MALPIMALLAGAGGLIGDLIDKMDGDKKRQAELLLKQIEAETANEQAQMQVNAAEAQHSSRFVAGWRPFIGWVCGIGLSYEFVVRPFLVWASDVYGLGAVPPPLGEALMYLTFSLLGIGGYRSIEKMKGVAR